MFCKLMIQFYMIAIKSIEVCQNIPFLAATLGMGKDNDLIKLYLGHSMPKWDKKIRFVMHPLRFFCYSCQMLSILRGK